MYDPILARSGVPAHVKRRQEIIDNLALAEPGSSMIPQPLGQIVQGFRLRRFRYVLQKKWPTVKYCNNKLA